MSNIANNIVALGKNLSQVFSDNRYRIDVFQRDYRWQYQHVDALISDLVSNFLLNYSIGHTLEDVDQYDCYYMGPIVVCDDQGGLSVVDGQQRLTTFSLLFIYLMHLQNECNIPEDLRTDFLNYLYVRRAGKKTFTLDVASREEMMRNLVNYGRHIPQDLLSNPEDINDCSSVINLKDRYEDICQLFPSDVKNENMLPLFIEWMLYKVIMVEIHAFSTDNAYTIFETMNDRGLNLNQTEILKAYILSKINDDGRSEEMNEFWRTRVSELKHVAYNEEADLAFFRAWLRSKYAQTIRQQSGNQAEDFEMIGSHFTNWFKNHRKEIGLKAPEDYYFFVKGSLEYFSSAYMQIIRLQREESLIENNWYFVVACYPMADSLYMPLLLSSIMPRDSQQEMQSKMKLVNQFVDIFINRRTLSDRSVNQSTIRRKVFEIIKKIRNVSYDDLQVILSDEIQKLKCDYSVVLNQGGFSSNYLHYLLARFIFYEKNNVKFSSLLRTRKRNSMVLCQIFSEEEWIDMGLDKSGCTCWSTVNYCLCPRQESDIWQINVDERLQKLLKKGYLPEVSYVDSSNGTILEIIEQRQTAMCTMVNEIWSLNV